MKRVFLLSILILLNCLCQAQVAFKINYHQLKEYNGIYQYLNNSTLTIAASPKDTILYAIINESKYKLTPFEKDLFLNMSNEKISFFRNKQNKIAGYIVNNDSFNLLSTKVELSLEMWYPRITNHNPFHYTYQIPKNDNDGLSTGDIEKAGLNKLLVDEMMNKIVAGNYPNTHSILIIKDNKLVFEEYFYEHNKNKVHELRSATKSIVSALTGIAIDKGYIKSKNETVLSFFPEYSIQNPSKAKEKITIENLLTNESGLDCDVSNPNSVGNETTMNNSEDWVKFTLDLPMIDSAGGKGMYCSGNPITLGRIIEKSTKQTLPDFAKENLFKPLGISNFVWNFKPDKSSVETFCQAYLTSRDLAKLGLLYLNIGRWKNKQIISENWVNLSLKKHSIVQGVDYGYLWWNKYLESNGKKYFSFAAQGNGGQKIYIFKELNMVIVTTGGNYNSQSYSDELIKTYILPAFK